MFQQQDVTGLRQYESTASLWRLSREPIETGGMALRVQVFARFHARIQSIAV